MVSIPFTQYLRPSGRPIPIELPCSEGLSGVVDEILKRGYRFEVEVLRTGEVSFTISDGEQDLAIELSANGPEVPSAIDRLISRFARKYLNDSEEV